ncbi:Uu.00g051000.m01.CDS01 [Anthostomella pinea]|uniref:Uu.00g051000.m01.CDS01 n=1 Tax=Anthostomella pinea TaxID=933095 RepID=A0AAI8YMN6_9PEZI|nr:Uu.00g051000.m01.CDS01 [Anthostomella pinea]
MAGKEGAPDSTQSRGTPRLTPKQKDPPVFTSDPSTDKDKTPVMFDQWFLILRKKLVSNTDHFPSDDDKTMYILAHLCGTASSRLMPFIKPDDTTGEAVFKTSKEVLDHLHEQYKDLNEQDVAKEKFNKLEITTGMEFKDFQLEFVRLAGMAKKDKSTWKEEMFKRLPGRLNTICLDKYHDKTVNYNYLCTYVQRHDYQQRKNFVVSQMRKNDAPQGQQNTNPPKNNGGGGGGSPYPPRNQNQSPNPAGSQSRPAS